MFANSCRAGLVVGLAFLLTAVGAAAAWSAPRPILTTLAREGRFKDFLHAVNTADLAGTLHGPGPITVFAPDDDAFAKMPPAQRQELMSNPEQLKRLLSFDIVPARVMVADLSRARHAQTPTTLEGDPLRVASAVGVTTVNGAPIVHSDIAAKNGVIQEVGSVIVPPTVITAPPGKYVPPARPLTPAPVRPPVTAPPPAQAPAPASPANPSAPTTLPMIPANPPTAPGAPGTPPAPANPPATNPPAAPPATSSAPAPEQPVNPPQSDGSQPDGSQSNGSQTNTPQGSMPGENAPP